MTSDPEKTLRQELEEHATPRSRSSGGQFAPGTQIAGRYRIAGILGAGGMGEVYRADDIKLDQPVALKFLPARLARDRTLLARLHDEVRLGRQITHPNVCRIYDIDEADGAHFVAMEYVDGEDLSRLLRRIGRLADDKAVDIARGIAAGLSAAHAKGILHRDLKPANVMVDSRGDARIMDFGLANVAGEHDGTISGTPAYMAPEQLQGSPATVQSELYALGLVMYELFTGKRAHSARTLPERMRDLSSEIVTPSSVIRDIDPAVERIILRCLANDPSQRPRSARDVIDSLPGGDPLAAALAAGETPSPRIVAAAGAEGSLSPRPAWAMLGAIALLLGLWLVRMNYATAANTMSLERSPEVLRQRANDIVQTLGIPVRSEPRTYFSKADDYVSWLRERDGKRQWEALRRGPAPFVLRVEYGIPAMLSHLLPLNANAPGHIQLDVDPQGRLTSLLAAPHGTWKPKPVDWKPLLEAGGFDPATLRAATPRAMPVAPIDTRAAWSGTYRGDPTPVHIEAAAWQGTPVFFRVSGEWNEKAQRERPFENRAAQAFQQITTLVILVATLLVAWRNLRLRRGDRQGALRVALVTFAFSGAASLLRLTYSAQAGELFTEAGWRLGSSALHGIVLFALYIAIEPYARRRWPEQLIAWARLVSGRLSDPLVGRHVLIGLIAGGAHLLLTTTAFVVSAFLSGRSLGPALDYPQPGLRDALASVVEYPAEVVSIGFFMFMSLVLLTMIVRRRPLASALLLVLNLAFFVLAAGDEWSLIPSYAAIGVLVWFVTTRYGLLAIGVTQATTFLLLFGAPQLGTQWLNLTAAISIAAVTALAIWAFRVSLGGQSPFAASLLDE